MRPSLLLDECQLLLCDCARERKPHEWSAACANSALLVSHLRQLIDLAVAVQSRQEAKCWSTWGPLQSNSRCVCGTTEDEQECPCTKADELVAAAYNKLKEIR
jgi:hypothetical protein